MSRRKASRCWPGDAETTSIDDPEIPLASLFGMDPETLSDFNQVSSNITLTGQRRMGTAFSPDAA